MGQAAQELAQALFEWADPVLEASSVAAEDVAEDLTKIPDGQRTPPNILDWARAHPASALYAAFDAHNAWDDTHAARQFRLETARRITRAIRVTVLKRDEPLGPPARVYTTDPLEPGYIETAKIRRDPRKSLAKRRKVFREVLSYLNRYRDIFEESQAGAVFIERAMDELRQLILDTQ